MNREIIESAWDLLNEKPNLKRFHLFPAIVSTFYLGVIFLYQMAFFSIYLFDLHINFFAWLIEVSQTEYLWSILTLIGIGIILYILTIPIADVGLISLIDRNVTLDKNPELQHGRAHFYSFAVSRGIVRFLPMMEFDHIMIPFKIVSIFGAYLLFIRLFGIEYIRTISIVMALYLALSIIVNTLFAYARFFIVFEGQEPFDAISASVNMTFDNLAETFQIYFMMLFLYARTAVTAGFFVLFPFLVSFLLTYLTIDYIRTVGLVVLGALFLLFFAIIVHLNSALDIFTQTIWYNMYQDNKSRKSAEGGSETKEESHKEEHHH